MNRRPGYRLCIDERVVGLQEYGDACLVKRGAAGDKDAFAALAGRYLEPVWTLIRYRVGDRAGAEDVLQETLLLAWLRLPQVREPSRVKAWLLRIAGNECNRYHRRKRAREVPAGDLPAATGAMWATDAMVATQSRYGRGTYPDQLEDGIDLANAVSGLPSAERQLVKGFYIEGFSLAELAANGRFPVGTAKSRLHSARNHLKRAMEE